MRVSVAWGYGAEEEGERVLSRLYWGQSMMQGPVSLTTPRSMTWAEIKCWVANRLSHVGTLHLSVFILRLPSLPSTYSVLLESSHWSHKGWIYHCVTGCCRHLNICYVDDFFSEISCFGVCATATLLGSSLLFAHPWRSVFLSVCLLLCTFLGWFHFISVSFGTLEQGLHYLYSWLLSQSPNFLLLTFSSFVIVILLNANCMIVLLLCLTFWPVPHWPSNRIQTSRSGFQDSLCYDCCLPLIFTALFFPSPALLCNSSKALCFACQCPNTLPSPSVWQCPSYLPCL